MVVITSAVALHAQLVVYASALAAPVGPSEGQRGWGAASASAIKKARLVGSKYNAYVSVFV